MPEFYHHALYTHIHGDEIILPFVYIDGFSENSVSI
jgi:hypothetical protein